jgi:hypothetical protein
MYESSTWVTQEFRDMGYTLAAHIHVDSSYLRSDQHHPKPRMSPEQPYEFLGAPVKA